MSDLIFYQPSTLWQAVELMQKALEDKKRAMYYSGSTEIMTNMRKRVNVPDILIDIKKIPEVMAVEERDEFIRVGAGRSLNHLAKIAGFSAIPEVVKGIADYTVNNRLSLGGNLMGTLPYREIILPLYPLNAVLRFIGKNGERKSPLQECFSKVIKRSPEELLVSVEIPKVNLAFYRKRETQTTEVDYPIMHLFVAKTHKGLCVGLSGSGSPPTFEFFKEEVSDKEVFERFEGEFKTDMRASAEYRYHLFKQAWKRRTYEKV